MVVQLTSSHSLLHIMFANGVFLRHSSYVAKPFKLSGRSSDSMLKDSQIVCGVVNFVKHRNFFDLLQKYHIGYLHLQSFDHSSQN